MTRLKSDSSGVATAPFVTAVVLAAGGSSRMGEPKQLLPWVGQPLIAHCIAAATAAQDIRQTVVVVGCEAERVAEAVRNTTEQRVEIVVNENWNDGIGSSLLVGLAAADPAAVAACVLLGDEPGVATALIDRVIDAFQESEKPVVRPYYTDDAGKKIPGHPAVVGREVWAELKALHGDSGLRSLLAANPGWLQALPVDGQAPFDIDTPQDYSRLGPSPRAEH